MQKDPPKQEPINYGKRSVEMPTDEGQITIGESYFGGQAKNVKEEVRIDSKTAMHTLLQDVIKALEDIKILSPSLTIKILKDRENRPYMIQKTTVFIKKKGGKE